MLSWLQVRCLSKIFVGTTAYIAHFIDQKCPCTDALSSMGLPPGFYHLGEYEIEVNGENVAYVKGTTTLAGR